MECIFERLGWLGLTLSYLFITGFTILGLFEIFSSFYFSFFLPGIME